MELLYWFNLSLFLEKVLMLRKTCVVLIPKTAHLREPSQYRPMVLTSYLIKALESTILSYFHDQVDSPLDTLQFAYRSRIGMDNVVIHLLHRPLCRL